MSKNKNVTIYNVIDIVNEVGFHKLNDAAKDAFMMILSKTKKGSVLINRPFHSSDFDSLHIYLERINDYLIRQKLVKDTNTPLITVKSNISLKEILQLIDQVNVYQLDSILMLNCLILLNIKSTKSISEILRDEDLAPIVESVQEDFTFLNNIFSGLPKRTNDTSLWGFNENFTKWFIKKNKKINQKRLDQLGDFYQKKNENKKGFQFTEAVIHPLRFWSILDENYLKNTDYLTPPLRRIRNLFPNSVNQDTELLKIPSARLLINSICDIFSDNVDDKSTKNKPKLFKIVTDFAGNPTGKDKFDLIRMVDPSEYDTMLCIRISSMQAMFDLIQTEDPEDLPDVIVDEVDLIYEELEKLMTLHRGLPVKNDIGLSGMKVRKNHSLSSAPKSLASHCITKYEELSMSKSIKKSDAQNLLEEIQNLIVNLKIRKTDPAAKDIDAVQRNLIGFLQGKSKVLSPIGKDETVGLLFGIEPIKRKRGANLGDFSAEKFFSHSNRSLNFAYVTVFDFPDKYSQLEELQLPFDIDILHKFYFQHTDFGNNPLLLIDNPTARVTILIMLDYINYVSSEKQNMNHIKPVLVSEFIPDDMSEDEMYEFLQYVDTKRYPKTLADEIEMINFSTSKLLFKEFGDGAPSDLLYASRRIINELKNIAAHLGGIVLIQENDLSIGAIRKRINKREEKRKRITGQFVENAVNSICAGKSKEEAANFLINELQEISKDSHFQTGNARTAIDRVVSDLMLIAKKKVNENKKGASKSNTDLAGWITNTVESENNAIDQVKPVMSIQEAANLPFNEIPFNGLLHQLFGRPELGFTAMMYGAPGCGKSTLALWMAKQIAIHHGRVLYVTAEQYPKGSITTLVNRMGMSNIKGIDLTKHLSHAIPDGYDFVFIDSVNSHKIRIQDFIRLKNQHPHKTFILILQSTKNKSYRGSGDWEHEVDNVIYLEPSKAEVTKARFLLPGSNEIEIPDLVGDRNDQVQKSQLSPDREFELAGIRKRKHKKEEDFSIWTLYDLDADDLEKTALKHDPDYKSLIEFLDSNPGGVDNLVRDLLRKEFAESNPNISVLSAQFERLDKSDNLISFQIKVHGTRKELEQITEPNGVLRYDWDSHEA